MNNQISWITNDVEKKSDRRFTVSKKCIWIININIKNGNEVTGKQIASEMCKQQLRTFFGEDRFCIPDYQRPMFGRRPNKFLVRWVTTFSNKHPDSQYFLGSLVLHCEPKKVCKGINYQENTLMDNKD
jgi:hypothetical protein